MRITRALAFGSLMLVAPSLHADKRTHKKPEMKLAVVDDEPMSQAATQKPDEIRVESLSTRGTGDPSIAANNRAVTPTAIGGMQTALPDAVAHTVAAPPDTTALPPSSLTDDALVELAAKQMRHERRALDACAADAQLRHPNAHGSVTLRFTVADRKVVNVAVDKDSLQDAKLTSCLVKAGHALKFSLKQASFYWPVSLSSSGLSPTASR